MGRGKKGLRTAALAAAASLLVSAGAAAASPAEELGEILTARFQGQDSLLAETLGLEELNEAIAEKGFFYEMTVGLDAQTLLAEQLEIPEDAYVSLGVQLDKQNREWMLQAALGSGGSDLLDATLTGSEEKLALYVPQLYPKTAVLLAGNLQSMYQGSALAQMLGVTDEDDFFPSIYLSFYPSEELIRLVQDLGDLALSLVPGYTGQLETLQENMQVEKTESGSQSIYTVSLYTEDLAGLVQAALNDVLTLSLLCGASSYEVQESYETINEVLAQIDAVCGEKIQTVFTVQGGQLQEISLELPLTLYEESYSVGSAYEEESEEEPADAQASDTWLIGLSVSFENVSASAENILYTLSVQDPTQQQLFAMSLDLLTNTSETAQTSAVSLKIFQDGETLYSATPFTLSFAPQTGEISMTYAPMGLDQTQSGAVQLEGTFVDVEPGVGFTLEVESLASVSSYQKVAGITGSMTLTTSLQTPKLAEEVVVLEQSQEELSSMIEVISMKAAILNVLLQQAGISLY